MTDAEIKKALKCCYYNGKDCTNCPCTDTDCTQIESYALDLINRKDAEIEELRAINENLKTDRPFLVKITRAEAIKEFAERLKDNFPYKNACYTFEGIEYRIDNLKKEMVGE